MSTATLVKPDREFVEELIASGGGDLKRCFQCATCSVACELSDGTKPFPRKEMVWAQWGLKDRLLADPDVWLCHQCNDCSTRCPRGARPGDVLAAVRHLTLKHYAIPRFLAAWASDARFLPLLLLFPMVVLGTAILARDPLAEALGFGEAHGFYAEFFPHWLLIGLFTFFSGLAALLLLVGVVRFWRAMHAHAAHFGADGARVGLTAAVVATVKSILRHDRFTKCERHVSRRWVHLMVFYGFAALLVVTMWAVTDLYVFPRLGIESAYPFDLFHPLKIVGNVGAVLLIYGCAKALHDRMGGIEEMGRSTSFDWLFVWLLLAVGVTGVVTEGARFLAEPTTGTTATDVAYALYFVHLVLVFALLVYLPYSKLAHVVYHAVARVYAERVGRTRPAALPGRSAAGPRLQTSTDTAETVPLQLTPTP